MKSCLFYGLFPLLLGILSASFHPNRALWRQPEPVDNEVSLNEIQGWKESVIWVDARSGQEYRKDHIPSAIELNVDNFESNLPHLLELWQPGCRVVVYCDTLQCDSSHEMAERLTGEVGLSDVYVLYGGWASWRKGQ
jgi:rhodanese-related sulfurtransferase